MVIQMDWSNATFKASDVIKMGLAFVGIVFFAATIKNDIGSVKEAVSDIRQTQIENTKKNDLRWETMQLQVNKLNVDVGILAQKVKALEDGNNKK